MKTIVLDTSFILTALQDKIDMQAEIAKLMDEKYELIIIGKTLQELKGKKQEKLAIAILRKIGCKVKKTEDTKKNVDSLIIAYAVKYPATIVATQDKGLKEKLKKRNIRLITIRQKKYLQMVN